MSPRKDPVSFSEPVLKSTLGLAGDKVYKRAIRNTHGDVLIAWGIVQSVFGAAARPEHAIALLPHFMGQVDEETDDIVATMNRSAEKPQEPRSGTHTKTSGRPSSRRSSEEPDESDEDSEDEDEDEDEKPRRRDWDGDDEDDEDDEEDEDDEDDEESDDDY